jgi:hypothetical protein
LVLFPTEDRIIDPCLYDLMIGVWHAKANPMIAVLAETVATFSNLYKNKGGRFKACPQLFQIWVMQHFLQPHTTELGRYQPNPVTATINIKREITREQQTIEAWKEYFRHLTCTKWSATFMIMNSGHECLVGSEDDSWKDKSWIPLFGPWNCIGYAPQMFLRQFRSQQIACNLQDMKDCEYSLWDKEGSNARWRDIGKMKGIASKYKSRPREFSSHYHIPTEQYLTWRNEVVISLMAERTPRLPKQKKQLQDYIQVHIQGYLKEKDEEIAKLKEEVQGLQKVQQDVYYLEGQVEALTSENQQLRQERGEKEAEKERWKKRCRTAEASEKIGVRQRERLQTQLENSEQQLATRERVIREYQAQVQDMEHTINIYQKGLQEKEVQVDQLNTELRRLAQIIQTLRDSDRRKNQLIETYQKMYEDHQKCKAEAQTSQETILKLEAEKQQAQSFIYRLEVEGLKLMDAVKEAHSKIRDVSDILSPYTSEVILEDLRAAQQALQPYIVTTGGRRTR